MPLPGPRVAAVPVLVATGARRLGLGALVEQLGIPKSERHRALGRALMTSYLWR